MLKAPNYFERSDIPIKSQQLPTSSFLRCCMLSLFRCRDLDLGLVILKLNRDLDIVKTYLHTENEVTR